MRRGCEDEARRSEPFPLSSPEVRSSKVEVGEGWSGGVEHDRLDSHRIETVEGEMIEVRKMCRR